jgi:hypothetical protein
VTTDAAFEGDGRFLYPYKNPGNNPDRIAFNLRRFYGKGN